jgi:hypothetical protein
VRHALVDVVDGAILKRAMGTVYPSDQLIDAMTKLLVLFHVFAAGHSDLDKRHVSTPKKGRDGDEVVRLRLIIRAVSPLGMTR